eukprot:COSAG02_NODE_74756_length_154_cov_54.363636_1_plen_41_part_10
MEALTQLSSTLHAAVQSSSERASRQGGWSAPQMSSRSEQRA